MTRTQAPRAKAAAAQKLLPRKSCCRACRRLCLMAATHDQYVGHTNHPVPLTSGDKRRCVAELAKVKRRDTLQNRARVYII
jgi:hypothetical protein